MGANNSSENVIYKCKKCHWTGRKNQLEYDTIETCIGSDQVELCPICGSCEVVISQAQ